MIYAHQDTIYLWEHRFPLGCLHGAMDAEFSLVMTSPWCAQTQWGVFYGACWFGIPFRNEWRVHNAKNQQKPWMQYKAFMIFMHFFLRWFKVVPVSLVLLSRFNDCLCDNARHEWWDPFARDTIRNAQFWCSPIPLPSMSGIAIA